MSSGQSWLAIGAMVLLSYLSLNFQRSQNVQVSSSLNYESVIAATGIGQSLLEEISGRAFDEITIGGTIENPDTLTLPNNLGTDSGEGNIKKFDDIDDFDGYTRIDTLSRLGRFECTVDVYYVDEGNLDVESMSQTFLKRIDIAIANSFSRKFDDVQTSQWYTLDTLYLSHIMSY